MPVGESDGMVRVIGYERAHAAALAATYNDLVAGLPYCYPVTATDFAAALGEGAAHQRLRANTGLVALEGDAVVGWAQAAVELPERPAERERGILRALWYARGHRAAGQALLEAAQDHLRDQGVTAVMAFHQDYRHPFYHMGHAYLSDRLEHIHALLGMNGYQRCAGEVYLEWPNFAPGPPGPPPLPVDLVTEWTPGRGRLPGLTLRALQEGRQLGLCINQSCGEYSPAEAAQDGCLTKWLGVEAEAQGRGLGRWLLQTALCELRGAGYRRAVISTSWTNHRACLFYSNCGYRAVDWTYALSRELQ
ncbi:MAG: GNAT family N-acetyltransferase [Armatimonadetes bacterium]|nr:GNAT family N-acetyltransferase [Armatimonadota bacterium]